MRDIIENFNLDRFIERLDNNNRLFIFCDKFTEVDLHPNKVDNHTMGQVFEELLRRFSEMSNETTGNTTRRGMSYGYWFPCCLRNTVKICVDRGLYAVFLIRVAGRAVC